METINLGKLILDGMSRDALISAARTFMRQRDELGTALRGLIDSCEPSMPTRRERDAWDKAHDAIEMLDVDDRQ